MLLPFDIKTNLEFILLATVGGKSGKRFIPPIAEKASPQEQHACYMQKSETLASEVDLEA